MNDACSFTSVALLILDANKSFYGTEPRSSLWLHAVAANDFFVLSLRQSNFKKRKECKYNRNNKLRTFVCPELVIDYFVRLQSRRRWRQRGVSLTREEHHSDSWCDRAKNLACMEENRLLVVSQRRDLVRKCCYRRFISSLPLHTEQQTRLLFALSQCTFPEKLKKTTGKKYLLRTYFERALLPFIHPNLLHFFERICVC